MIGKCPKIGSLSNYCLNCRQFEEWPFREYLLQVLTVNVKIQFYNLNQDLHAQKVAQNHAMPDKLII